MQTEWISLADTFEPKIEEVKPVKGPAYTAPRYVFEHNENYDKIVYDREADEICYWDWPDFSSYAAKKKAFLNWKKIQKATVSLGPIQGQRADLLVYDDLVPVTTGSHSQWISLSNNNIPTRKEYPMCYKCDTRSLTATAAPVVNISAPDAEATQRSYLANRLDEMSWPKEDMIREFFYKIDKPKTKAEILKRLKDGLFSLDDDDFDKDGNLKIYREAASAISWRLKPVDEAAYEAARKAYFAEKQKVADAIAIFSPAEALKAVQAFEAWMPEGVTAQ